MYRERCGDGIAQVGVEACDDGNSFDNDACLTNCQPSLLETGFDAKTSGPGQNGYGVRRRKPSNGDGCSNDCRIDN